MEYGVEDYHVMRQLQPEDAVQLAQSMQDGTVMGQLEQLINAMNIVEMEFFIIILQLDVMMETMYLSMVVIQIVGLNQVGLVYQ